VLTSGKAAYSDSAFGKRGFYQCPLRSESDRRSLTAALFETNKCPSSASSLPTKPRSGLGDPGGKHQGGVIRAILAEYSVTPVPRTAPTAVLTEIFMLRLEAAARAAKEAANSSRFVPITLPTAKAS